MGSITDVPGISVGHFTDSEAATGCTVILFENGAKGAVDLRGGGTSTRQIDPLLEHHSFGTLNAILFAGGSAYGLNAAGGVMQYLEENQAGLDVGGGLVVPSVPTAVIFDLRIGNGRVRPDAEMGYSACLNATDDTVAEGSVGAGTGASIGKLKGIRSATKGGIGSESMEVEPGVWVGVLVVVNAFGDVIDPASREIIAGARSSPESSTFLNTTETIARGRDINLEPFQNTTLALVATNAGLEKPELLRIARIAQTGISRTISPSHTVSDGDAVFVVSVGEAQTESNRAGIIASELISRAIVGAVKNASSLHGVPSHSELISR